MSENLTITLESNERSWTFGSFTTYGIITIDGLSALDISINSADSAQYDGINVEGVHVGARHITAEINIAKNENTDATRDWLLGFLNPHYPGIMTITRNGRSRKIIYYIAERHTEQENLHSPLDLVVDFLCPYPYFTGETFSKNIAQNIPALFTGFNFFKASGFTVSWKEFSDEVTLENSGDVDAGLDIVFTAAGAVINPKILNETTGKFMRIIVTLKSGDVLRITTGRGNKRIELNGVNISHKKDRDSEFFQIVTGKNILKYSADDGYKNLNCLPKWSAQYMGA